MGISDKINQVGNQLQDGIKNSSVSLLALSLKIITAFMISLTVTLIVQELTGSGMIAFTFLMLVLFLSFFKLMKNWITSHVLLFDLFCILVALVLKLYLQVAP